MQLNSSNNLKKITATSLLISALLVLAIAILWPANALSQQHKFTGTYSSLTYHEQSGDLIGAELRIVYTRKGLQGMLQIAEGGAGELILITSISIEEEQISFEFQTPDNVSGAFKGRITRKGVIGNLAYKNGAVLKLNLIRKRSYWE